jgi:hypothetical protein
MYQQAEKHLCEKKDHLAHCFPVRIEVDFERKMSCYVGYLRWRMALIVPNKPIQLRGRNTCVN